LWSHVVGYEEGDPAVTQKLALGYPRFVYHPYIRQLAEVRPSLSLRITMHTIQALQGRRFLSILSRSCEAIRHACLLFPPPLTCLSARQVWKDRAVKQGLIQDKEGTAALPLPTKATAER
jgi:hypothetical protein